MAGEFPAREFHIKRNDRLPLIEQILLDADGKAVDLTGASVVFKMATDVDGVPGTVKVSAAATIVTALEGRVRYSWAAGDTDTAGAYLAEWEVTTGGLKQTYPNPGYQSVIVTADVS